MDRAFNAKATADLMTQEMTDLISDEITRATETAFTALNTRLVEKVRTEISNRVIVRIRPVALFKPGYGRVSIDRYIDYEELMDDEYIIINIRAPTEVLKITNYGRGVFMDFCDGRTTRDRQAGIRLTTEIIDYLQAISPPTHVPKTRIANLRSAGYRIIDKYQKKYALASIAVHTTREDEIRADEQTKLVTRSAELDAREATIEKMRQDLVERTYIAQVRSDCLADERREFETIKKRKLAPGWSSSAHKSRLRLFNNNL